MHAVPAVGAATATGRGAGRNVARAHTVQSLLDRQASKRAPSASVEPYQAASQALRRSLSNVSHPAVPHSACHMVLLLFRAVAGSQCRLAVAWHTRCLVNKSSCSPHSMLRFIIG